MIYADFIAAFPEFSNLAEYPQARINFWLNYATLLINQDKWKTLTPQGISLLTAHQLILDKEHGTVNGLTTGKAVDSVSKNMDVKVITYADAGHYNKTTYGLMFWKLVMLVGTAPLQFN